MLKYLFGIILVGALVLLLSSNCAVYLHGAADLQELTGRLARLEQENAASGKAWRDVTVRLESLERRGVPGAPAEASATVAGTISASASARKRSAGTPGSVLGFGTSTDSLRALYAEFSDDVRALKMKMMRWANDTDLHQGINDVEAEIIYLRLRKLRPSKVAELGFGQGLATRYFLQALEDNGHGHLYTFDLKDQWNRAPKMELQERWTFTLGDGRKTLDRFGPYEYVHSDCEHSTDFSKFIGDWLTRKQGASPILFSFHDVYKYLPRSEEAKCEGGMHRGADGVTPEGRIMLDRAAAISTSPLRGSFTVASSHATGNWEEVQDIRHTTGLDDDWVGDTEKYRDATHLRKDPTKTASNVSPECKRRLKKGSLNPMIFFEV